MSGYQNAFRTRDNGAVISHSTISQPSLHKDCLENCNFPADEGPVVSRSLQRNQTQLQQTLLRSLTFVDMKGSALEQSLNIIHEFDKSNVGR